MIPNRVAKWLWMFMLMCASSFVQGQVTMTPHTSGSYDFQLLDHTSNCTVAHGHNCFSTSSGGVVVQLIVSHGKQIGIDSSGYAYTYSDPIFGGNNTWTKQTAWGSGLSYVQYGSDGNLYALRDTCSGSGHIIEKLVGSTWQTVAGCFTSFSMDQTGTGLEEAIDLNGALWQSTNYGVSFAQQSTCSPNGVLSVVVLNSTIVGVVCRADNSIWYGALSSLTKLPGAAGQITGMHGKIYVTGATDHNVYRWVLGTNTTQWDQFVSPGGIAFLNFGDESNLWAVGSGGIPNRYTEWAIRGTRTYNATTTCNGNCPNQNSIPPVHHNATTQAQWIINGRVVSNGTLASSGNVDPTTQVQLFSYADLDTPVDCFVYASSCLVGVNTENYHCSEVGTLADDSGSNSGGALSTKLAHTHSQWLTPVPPTEIDKGLWEYKVAPECSNTSSPLFNPNFIYADHDFYVAFDEHSTCISIFGTAYHCFYPYLGLGALPDKSYYSPDPGPQYCDQ